MNILVLASDVPATSNMPGSPRLFSLCKSLSRRHKLTLIAQSADNERYRAFMNDPASEGVFEKIVRMPKPTGTNWWPRQVHRFRHAAHFVTRYRNPGYHAEQCEMIRTTGSQATFDVVYVDGLVVAQYFMDSGLRCPALIDLHDCLTLLYKRMARQERRWLRKLALYAETKSIQRCERSLNQAFGLIVLNSRVDELFFKELDTSAQTLTIGNGVDSEFFRPSNSPGDLSRLIFTGVMNYGPNEDAAGYFCDDILPLVQKRYPDVEFWIVGKDPTDRVRNLARRPGVRVTGGVPDIRPYVQRAGIFVCPIRYGAGIKNKLLAALAMKKAVVATRLSIDGLDLIENQDLVIVDASERFAAEVIRLMEEPGYARRLGQTGYASVIRKFSWESSGAALEDALLGIVNRSRVVN